MLDRARGERAIPVGPSSWATESCGPHSYKYSPDPQGSHTHCKVQRGSTLSVAQWEPPSLSHLPREKVQSREARLFNPSLPWYSSPAPFGLAWAGGGARLSRVRVGGGRGQGPRNQGGPTALHSQQACFQDNLIERRAGGGGEALGSCHWTLICPAKAGGCPRVNPFLTLS